MSTLTPRRPEPPPRGRPGAVVRCAAVVAAAAAALGSGPGTGRGATEPPAIASGGPQALQPGLLAQADTIRGQTDARYRKVPGRKLAVTEASSLSVLGSLTLATGGAELFRVVPTADGIYFAICPAGARCPYPSSSASWPARAALPLRQSLELAVRTFAETPATLVVVALPTAEPLWVVFERDDLLAAAAVEAPLARLVGDPAVADPLLRASVDRLVVPRLYRPIPLLPPTLETMLAVPAGWR
jgi:hypothetical protein